MPELRGTPNADTLRGGDGADQLYGEDGDDILIGLAGDDTLYGGAGDDRLYAGYDVTAYPGDLGSHNFLYGGAGNDVLISGEGIDFLDGGDGDDRLAGGDGDTLKGGLGNDSLGGWGTAILDGGDGDDQLLDAGGRIQMTGGAGADVFAAEQTSSNRWNVTGFATVTDFNAAEGDRIMLAARSVNPLVFRGAVDSGFMLADKAVFSGRDYGAGFTQVWTWRSAGDTYLLIDNDGDGKLTGSDYVLKLSGVEALTRANMFTDPRISNFGFLDTDGTDGPDVFQGTDETDIYYGLDGDDEIHGGGGYYDYLYGGNGADKIWGEAGEDWIYAGAGDDTVYGGQGNDFIWGSSGSDVIWGGDGDDYIEASGGPNSAVDAPDAANIVHGEAGNDSISGVGSRDKLYGGEGDDGIGGNGELFGEAGADVVNAREYAVVRGGDGDDIVGGGTVGAILYGDAGKDSFQGGSGATIMYVELGDSYADGGDGDDVLYLTNARAGEVANLKTAQGGAGSDRFEIQERLGVAFTLNGGDGLDTVARSGQSSGFNWSRLANGSWTLVEAGQANSLTLNSVETFKFSDKTISLTKVIIDSTLRGAGPAVADLEAKIAASELNLDGVLSLAIKAADESTSVASLAYQFFTGKIPTEGGIDYLVSPTGPNGNNLNSAYYQSFNLENRYINFAVNLGKTGEGKDAFTAKYGLLSLVDATREAYKTIFGAAPTDAHIHAMIDTRIDYFAAYGGDGANGIGTKAAMVGWLLAEAVKADLGVMARSNDAWLMDLADGSAPFAIDILDPAKGYYKADFIFGGA